MALTQDQLIQIRRKIGTAPDDAALDAIYDRVGDLDELVLEVLEIRLADMMRAPSSFAVPGEYSQSTSENIRALERDIAALGGPTGLVRIVPAASRPSR